MFTDIKDMMNMQADDVILFWVNLTIGLTFYKPSTGVCIQGSYLCVLQLFEYTGSQ